MYVYCSKVAFLKLPKSHKIALNWLIPTDWDADDLSGATAAVLNPYAKAYVSVSLVVTSKTDEHLPSLNHSILGSTLALT